MQIRIMGTEKEANILIKALKQNASDLVLEISKFYPNRGDSKLGRIYVNATLDIEKILNERSLAKTEKEEITLANPERH